MDLLEMDETRTCNITSVGMALEALGIAPSGSEGGADLQAIADTYPEALGGAADRVGGELTKLRLPDYLQLVAIAEVLGDAEPTAANIRHAGARMEIDAKGRTEVEGAWKEIKNIHFLAKLARRFGVSAEVVTFNLTSNDPADEKERRNHRLDDFSALRGIGSRHRDQVEKMVDARNRREQLDALPAGDRRRRKLEQAVAKDEERGVLEGEALSPASLAEQEEQVPLQEYMDRVRQTIGVPLDEGAQVVVSMSGHYARLQAIAADHVIVDDPATRTSANRKVTWQEARAMGYFQSCLIIR
jgi:hypothetical protein